ncbi:MAG: isoprenyl transferase [Candidatus Omnitrophota bacterium]
MKMPRHIAIIMDGNGRWAKKKGLPRIMGHRSGVETVSVITEACAMKGVEVLTLYAFSSENWKRPQKEVDALMDLLGYALDKNREKVKRNNIKMRVIGRVDGLSRSLAESIRKIEDETASNSGMVLALALNYGGRQEILDAVEKICDLNSNSAPGARRMTEEDFGKFLYTRDLPDPDLIIRTSGEMRLSNFLLWQAAYSEFYITDTLWPDFDVAQLEKALKEYGVRERRFGE